MKMLLASLLLTGSFAAFAADQVQIQITASTEELCRTAAQRLVETSRDLEAKNLDIIEISNCNKTRTGKFVKKVKYKNVIDYNH